MKTFAFNFNRGVTLYLLHIYNHFEQREIKFIEFYLKNDKQTEIHQYIRLISLRQYSGITHNCIKSLHLC